MQASLNRKRYSLRLFRIAASWAATLMLAAFLVVAATAVGCGSESDPEPTLPTERLKITDGEDL